MTIEVVIGRISRPHGIRGELTVEVRTDEAPRRFAVGSMIRVDGESRSYQVLTSRWHQGRLLLTLSGVDDRNAAERLRGSLLVTDVDESEPAGGEDEYWDRDLVGLEVRRADGSLGGRVSGVVHLAHQDLLEVATDAGSRLVPLVAGLVPQINTADGWLQLADVDGLLADPQ